MQEENKYLTISELNRIIKMKFDASSFFNKVFIKGEISNFKMQMPSGHCYFTIKDEGSRLSAIMFRGTANKVGTDFKDGDMINAVGKISIYEASGSYQIYIESMELSGAGDLYKKFLELKDKLYKEGLFSVDHKRLIPRFPKKIGVVTASTGAAIKDIIITIKRRYPLCSVLLFPSLVQGSSAKDDIVKKIELANTYDDIDILIVGRGGGSIEDLWAYNEEIVARAIYNSRIPVISAVGHEIDFTIADYVADKRAATPTAAAELAVPNIEDIIMSLDTTFERLNNVINNKLNNYKMIIDKLKVSNVLINPLNIYNIKFHQLTIYNVKLNKYIENVLNNNLMKLVKIKNNYIFTNPSILTDKLKDKIINNLNKLDILNPLNSLKRGYSIVKKDNKCIESITTLKIDDKININLYKGEVEAIITNIKEEI